MRFLRRAILMKANPVVSLHAHRLFSGRACSSKKDPCSNNVGIAAILNLAMSRGRASTNQTFFAGVLHRKSNRGI